MPNWPILSHLLQRQAVGHELHVTNCFHFERGCWHTVVGLHATAADSSRERETKELERGGSGTGKVAALLGPGGTEHARRVESSVKAANEREEARQWWEPQGNMLKLCVPIGARYCEIRSLCYPG